MLALAGVLGLLAVLFGGRELWHSLRDGYLLLLALATLALLLVFNAPSRAERWLGGRWLAWLRSWGRLSYEIYLSHMFVVYAAVRLYRTSGARIEWGLAWYALALPLCWLLGWLVARGFSQPCERWLRRRGLARHSRSGIVDGAVAGKGARLSAGD